MYRAHLRSIFVSRSSSTDGRTRSGSYVAGALVGALLGAVEASYALYFSTRSPANIAGTLALVLAATSLSGALIAWLLSLLARLRRWGDAVQTSKRTSMVSAAISVAITTAPVALSAHLLAPRRHALLGALSIALVSLGSAALARVLSRALARKIDARRDKLELVPDPRPFTALALHAVAIAALLLLVARLARWPLAPGAIALCAATYAIGSLASLSLAPTLARLVCAHRRASIAIAATVALIAAGATVLSLRAVLPLVSLGVIPWLTTPLAWLAVERSTLARRARPSLAALVVLAQLATLAIGSRNESARKTVSTRAIAADLALRTMRAGLDFDRDGHARWLGGDCRDDDSAIHPGALDWPGDGVDSDCDGSDSRLDVPPRRPFIVVPENVVAQPNLLLITIDAMRADHLGAYGYTRPTSPRLDALARESVVFDRAYANAPSTRLSMPAIATGRWAPTIQWDNSIWWPRFTTAQRTIAEVLHERGYHTGGVFSIPYFRRSDARGFERGMDEYDDRWITLHSEVGGPHESTGSSAREVADSAGAFVESNRQRPWFLWAHFFDPHHQYVTHEDGVTPRFGDREVDRYDAEVHFTDQHIGRVLDRLRASGQWERTVIVVTGDHGEGFGEHAVNTHGFHLYGAQTQVPMIVRVPGVAAKRTRVPVSHVDIAPTLANLAGANNERTFLGRTMVDALAYSTRPEDDGEVLQEVTFDNTVHRWGLVTATHHVLWNETPDNTRQCFDLRTDLAERADLFDDNPQHGACSMLFDHLARSAIALRLGPDFAQRLVDGVFGPDQPRPAVEHPLEAQFDRAIRLVGWDGETVIRRGQPHTIALHFDVLSSVEPGWELFVHLMGDQRSRNLEHPMVQGAFPLARWREGQRVRDRFTFTVPADFAPGRYALVLGFYKDNARMSITPPERGDALKRVQLSWFEVQ